MIRISKMTDYAILVMGALAKRPEAILSAASLASTLRLSVPTVSKILKTLLLADLVKAMRGSEGGYCLSQPAASITIARVVAAMEGDLAVTECCESSRLCTIDSFCALKENWKKINKMLNVVLSKWTIQDMLKPL
ncbi:MAG: SUF system Fe-S cluster assembly regulator [Gammaproteobacteria bacterium RIFCSPHIGHO2_12_FULL_42_10]|nr:MAG: SUF system Fe-S cluster assembly regulator [Gammaproteobacteria bacterium RIFCSPHIGHO2_12_FULL_42_10]